MQPDLHKRHCFLNQYKNKLSTFFSDDQVIIADSDDNLQRGVIALQVVANIFGVEI
jgi:hypothetical protein